MAHSDITAGYLAAVYIRGELWQVRNHRAHNAAIRTAKTALRAMAGGPWRNVPDEGRVGRAVFESPTGERAVAYAISTPAGQVLLPRDHPAQRGE